MSNYWKWSIAVCSLHVCLLCDCPKFFKLKLIVIGQIKIFELTRNICFYFVFVLLYFVMFYGGLCPF